MYYTGEYTNLKIDPYELCPCGSDKKFKFCCYQKARKVRDEGFTPKNYNESRMNHELLKVWESTDFKFCFGFDETECDGQIKSAHSIQNNRILNKISHDNHVYSMVGKISNESPIASFKKISKNKASTFFGFCDTHDTELFKPIELKAYNNEPEQNFLFAFRAHAIEYHKKLRKLNNFREIFKINPSALIRNDSVYAYRVCELDIEDCKKDYENFKLDYIKKDYSRLRTFYRRLDYEVNFAASSSFCVQNDLEENEMNKIYDSLEGYMPSIYLNVYP
ncbi:SEC-C domain-containing protein, partial [Peribacillus frigoritolerans]|uniref:SEC-C domain-containing protein n=1 Tax=Peribacillus frigoritolerans TaxID=450367 RepID=UPI00362CFEBC